MEQRGVLLSIEEPDRAQVSSLKVGLDDWSEHRETHVNSCVAINGNAIPGGGLIYPLIQDRIKTVPGKKIVRTLKKNKLLPAYSSLPCDKSMDANCPTPPLLA